MGSNLFTNFQNSNDDSEDSQINPEQLRFENEMAAHIPTLVGIIEQAHYEMLAEISNKHPDYLNHLSKSVRMHEQIKGMVTDEFGTKVKKLKYNRFGLFDGNYVLLFKKLDDYSRPSNISTNYSNMLITQGKLNFPGEPKIIHVGYIVGKTWEELKLVNAVSITDRSVDWICNLRAKANQLRNIVTPAHVASDDQEIIAVPKQKQKMSQNGQ